jgi:hypothetical protein
MRGRGVSAPSGKNSHSQDEPSQEDWDARMMQISVDVHAKMGIAAVIELRDQLNQLLGVGEGKSEGGTLPA